MHPIEVNPAALPAVPGYDLLRLIGEGGMGRVYLARQRTLGRTVCVKLLAMPQGEGCSGRRERFEREAKILAMVAHPHVLTILDFGTLPDDGPPYLVTEYIENGDLRKLLQKDRSITPARRRSILSQIGQALSYLHEKKILHRDLKPENILTPTDSLVKVADFGLAVLQEDRGRLTETHQGIGTLVYASPEQQNGGQVDARSDQYSLAAVSYELLTGKRPVGSFKSPSEIDSTLDRRVDGVVMKALSREPQDRYADLDTFLAELDGALAPRASTLGRALFAGALLAIAAAATAAYRGAWFQRPDPPPQILRLQPNPPPVDPFMPGAEPDPDFESSVEFRELTTIRAREIWVSQGSPRGEAGQAVSLANWVNAERQIREELKARAFDIWKAQGEPAGAAGDAVRGRNMRQALSELLKAARALHPELP
ncbi:serine/threonine-protein kinase [Paludisphaera mucosa]|uniref:Serine/threonine-protein kinase n=1 Tax=Paludisphaera mucosa TaxID=3030827 RepID=A0ABT6F7U2_9BACT|nr:serine/threonine-protein kinase [Paludisphaera mucosa]